MRKKHSETTDSTNKLKPENFRKGRAITSRMKSIFLSSVLGVSAVFSGVGIGGGLAERIGEGTQEVFAATTQVGDTDAKQRCEDILNGTLPSGYHYAKDTDEYSPKMGIVGSPGNAAVVGGAAKSNSTNGTVTDSDSNTFSSVLPFGTIYIDATALIADNRVLNITDTTNFARNANKTGADYTLQHVNTVAKSHEVKNGDTILYTGGIDSVKTEKVIGNGTDELFSLTYPNAAVLHDETRGDLVLSFKKVTFISNELVEKFEKDTDGHYSGLPISVASDNNLSIAWWYLNPETGFPLSKSAHFGRTIKKLKDPVSGNEVNKYTKDGFTYEVNSDGYVEVTQSGTKIGTYYFEWKYDDNGAPVFVRANWAKESSYAVTTPAAPSFDESESNFGGLGYYNYNATSKQYTRIGAETLRIGAEYIVEYKVVKNGAEQQGSFLYAVNDLDVIDHNVYGKNNGDYSEGLEIVNGALSYAVVPEYKNSTSGTEHSIGTGTTLKGSQTPLFIDATNHKSSDNFANGIRFAAANLTDENTFDTGFAVVLNAKGTMRWTGSSAINMGTKLFDTTNYWHIEQTATNGIIYAETYDLENNCAAKQHTGEITAGTGDTVHHASKANDGYHLEEIIIDGQSVPPSVIANIKNNGTTETTWKNPNDGQVYKFTYDTNGVLRVAFEDIHANHKIHVGYEPDDQYRYVQKQWVGGEASDRKEITLIAQAYRQTPVYYASAKDGWRTSNNSPKGPGGTDIGFPAKKLADPNGDGVVYLVRAEYYPTDIGITRTIMSSDTDLNKLQWTWDGRSLWYISDTFLNTEETRTTVDNSSLTGAQDDKDNSIDVLPAWSGAELDKDSSVQGVINEFLNTQGNGKGKTVNFNAWIRILGGNNGAYNVQKVKDDNYMGTYLPTIQAAALLPVDGYDAEAALGSGTASPSGYTVKLTIPVDSNGAPDSSHVTANGNTWTIAWPVFGDSSDGSLSWPALPQKDAAGNDLYWFVTEETPEDWDTVRYKNGGDMPIVNYGISGQNAQGSLVGRLNLRDGIVADSVNPNILGGYGNTNNTAKSPGHTSHAYLGNDVNDTYKNAGIIANQQLTDVTFTKQWYDTVTSHTKDTLLTELGDKLHLMAEVDGVGNVDVTEFYLNTASKTSRKYTDTDGTTQKDYITVTDGTGDKAFDIKFDRLPTYWFGDTAPGIGTEAALTSSNYTQLVETDNKWTNYGFNTDWNRTKNVTVDLDNPHKINRYYLTEGNINGYVTVYDNTNANIQESTLRQKKDKAYDKGEIDNIIRAEVKAEKIWDDFANDFKTRQDVVFHIDAQLENGSKVEDVLPAQKITKDKTNAAELLKTWGSGTGYTAADGTTKVAKDVESIDGYDASKTYTYDEATYKYTDGTNSYYVDVLPAYTANGKKITYTVRETKADGTDVPLVGYKDAVIEKNNSKSTTDASTNIETTYYDVTNELEKVDFTLTKQWVTPKTAAQVAALEKTFKNAVTIVATPGSGSDIEVVKNGSDVYGYADSGATKIFAWPTATVSADGKTYTYKWTGLPKYIGDGTDAPNEAVYSATETILSCFMGPTYTNTTDTGETTKALDKGTITNKQEAPTGNDAESWGQKGNPQTGSPTFTKGTNKIDTIKLVDPATGKPTDSNTVNALDDNGSVIGTYKLNDNGTVTFTPNADFVGTPKPAKLIATDEDGLTATATYKPHVYDVEPLVSKDGQYDSSDPNGTNLKNQTIDANTAFDLPKTIDKIKLIDPTTGNEADSVTTSEGTYTIDSNGKITFTPASGFTGKATGIQVRATDTDGNTAITTYAPIVVPNKETQTIVHEVEYRYVDESGNEVTGKHTDTVTVTRIGDYNPSLDNDKENYSDTDPTTTIGFNGTNNGWKQGNLPEVTSPADTDDGGWEPNKTKTDAITAITPDNAEAKGFEKSIDPTTGAVTWTKKDIVIYTPKAPTSKDAETYGAPHDDQTKDAKSLFSVTTPKTAKDGSGSRDDNEIVEVKLIDPDTGDTTDGPVDAKDANGQKIGTYTIDSATGIITFHPDENYDGSEDPLPVEVKGTDKNGMSTTAKYQPHFKPDFEEKVVKRTIEYKYDDGKPVLDSDGNPLKVVQEVKFKRTASIDPDTGNQTWGEWDPVKDNMPEVISPTESDPKDADLKAGYVPEKEKAEAVTGIVPDDRDITETIVYIRPPSGTSKTTFGLAGEEQKGTPEFTKGTGNIPTTGAYTLTDPDTDNPNKKTIPGEGTYTLNPDTGEVSFVPEDDFKGEGTGVTVQVTDEKGLSATAKYTPVVAQPPESEGLITKDGQFNSSDGSIKTQKLSASLIKSKFKANGNTSDGSPNDIVEIKLDVPKNADGSPVDGASVSDDGKTVKVPGEGTYTMDDEGNISFTPDENFKGKGKGVTITGKDKNGLTTSSTYTPIVVPNKETQTIVHEVEYKYTNKDGQEVTDKRVETLTVERIGDYNPNNDNHPTEYGKSDDPDDFNTIGFSGENNGWTPVSTKAVTSPKDPDGGGWTPDKAQIPVIADITPDNAVAKGFEKSIDPDTGAVTWKKKDIVVYTPEAPTPKNAETYGAPHEDQKQTAKSLFNITTPKTAKDGSGSRDDNEIVEIALIDPKTGKPTSSPVNAYNESGEKIGTYSYDASTGKITFHPDSNYDGKGDPLPVKVKGTDKNGMSTIAEYKPHFVPNVEETSVKRTIYYKYDDGKPVLDSDGNPLKEEQVIKFTRTAIIDAETGKKTWKDWEPVSGSMKQVKSPTQKNPGKADLRDKYVPGEELVEGVTGIDPEDESTWPKDYTVYYIKPPQGSEKTSFGGKGDKQSGKPDFEEGSTKITEYKLVDADGNKVDKLTVPGEGTYVIATDGTITFTPEPDFIGKAKGVKVVATDENEQEAEGYYTPTVVDNEQTQTVKRTIKYVYDDNTPVLDDNGNPVTYEEILTFTRKGKVDPETGTVSWNNWKAQSYGDVASKDKVSNDVNNRFTPDKEIVEGESTTPDDGDKEVKVVYSKRKFTVIYDDGSHGTSSGGFEPGAEYGNKVKGGNKVTPEKNYVFTGRYSYVITKPDGTVEKGETDDPASVTVTGDIVFTPIYESAAATYWVTYVDPDGTTIYLEKTTINKGDAEPKAPADPSKEDYSFEGWERVVDDEGNVTYIAKWTKKEYGTIRATIAKKDAEPEKKTADKPAKTKNVRTGDQNNVMLWISIALGAGLTQAIVIAKFRKRGRRRR